MADERLGIECSHNIFKHLSSKNRACPGLALLCELTVENSNCAAKNLPISCRTMHISY